MFVLAKKFVLEVNFRENSKFCTKKRTRDEKSKARRKNNAVLGFSIRHHEGIRAGLR